MYVCVYFLFLFISNKVYKLTHGTESGLSLKPPQLDAESNPGMSEHVCVCVCVCFAIIIHVVSCICTCMCVLYTMCTMLCVCVCVCSTTCTCIQVFYDLLSYIIFYMSSPGGDWSTFPS